jgi:hypothetical protein
MKLYLASFLEPENFGPGKIISITCKSKPKNLEVKDIYMPFTPSLDMLDTYRRKQIESQDDAGTYFAIQYNTQLKNFVDEVLRVGQEENKTPQELLPFKDGDTLASWERKNYTHYRKTLAPYLKQLNYQIELN